MHDLVSMHAGNQAITVEMYRVVGYRCFHGDLLQYWMPALLDCQSVSKLGTDCKEKGGRGAPLIMAHNAMCNHSNHAE